MTGYADRFKEVVDKVINAKDSDSYAEALAEYNKLIYPSTLSGIEDIEEDLQSVELSEEQLKFFWGEPKQEEISYKFNEEEILRELKEYIDTTYFSHYAKGNNKVQTTELICSDALRGLHFCLGNAMKYSDRFGFKDGYVMKDLFKAAHYIVMAINCAKSLTEERRSE